MRFSLVLTLVAFVLSIGVSHAAESPWAQFADPVFVRLPSTELPNQLVQAVTTDATGFVWIGTQAGLARFDGYDYRIFLPNPNDKRALPDGFINTIVPDSDGGLWIGCNSGGLVRYDPATESFHAWPHDRLGRSGPRSAAITAIASDVPDSLLVGGEAGLDHFDTRTHVFRPIQLGMGGGAPAVYSILVDRLVAGRVWVATENGLYYRRSASAPFTPFALPRNGAARIRSLYQDGEGRLLAGGEGALDIINRARTQTSVFVSSENDAHSLEPGAVLTMIEAAPGVIWAGGYGGLSIVDLTTHHVRRVESDLQFAGGFVGGRVFTLFRDRSGLIWLGGDGGLIVHNANARGLYALSATKLGLGPSGVDGAKGLALSRGRLWVGGYLGRLVALDPSAGTITPLAMPNGLFVRKLATHDDSALWLGAGDQFLCLLQTNTSGITCPAGPTAALNIRSRFALETTNDLWIATYDGLFDQNKRSGRITHYRAGDAATTLSNGTISALLADREGRMWVGTYRGLNLIDPHTTRIARFLNRDLIAALFEDRRGRLWAAVNGGPLNVLQFEHGSVQIRRLDRSSGMPNDDVSAIAEDPSGRIWVSTDRGIAYFDPITLHAHGLDLIDGVTGNGHWNGAVAQSADGTIFFGGSDGVTVVAPGAASPWNYAPPVVVTSVTVGGHRLAGWSVNRGTGVELPAQSRNVSVEFAALDYSGPQAIRYQYKLDGFNRDWIDADAEHRISTYTNLHPGSYTLRIRATNRLGVWSTHELALRMSAPPAWFETWWFRAALGVLLIALLLGAHGMRAAALRRRQRELEALVDERTRELFTANENLYASNAMLSAANVKLQEMSLTDPLTGLRNRRFLVEHLEADVAAVLRRYEAQSSHPSTRPPENADLLFFLVDIDHFKAVNDEFGHHAGDMVLTQMRERLEEVFRTTDIIVRWGGEEFLAIARFSNRKDAGEMAERLSHAIADRPFALEGGMMLSKSASIGFAAFPFVPSSPKALTWSQVVDLADDALYMAKHAGRDTWFGLMATERTDPRALVHALAISPEAAVDDGALQIVSRSRVTR